MPERIAFVPGQPCWVDLTTPDLAASRDFYGGLLGWNFHNRGPEFGNYTMCLVGEATVAGLTPRQVESTASPLWSLYLSSPDVPKTTELITAAGGSVLMEPVHIPGQGCLAYAFDPTGAGFGVWESGEHIGTELYREPGALCWADLNTRHGAVADTFYREVFGYQQAPLGDGTEFDYCTWYAADEAVCGRLQLPADFPDSVPAHWMVYFAVADADAVATRARELGGTVEREPINSPFGRLCIITDPHGAIFTVTTLAKTPTPAPATAPTSTAGEFG